MVGNLVAIQQFSEVATWALSIAPRAYYPVLSQRMQSSQCYRQRAQSSQCYRQRAQSSQSQVDALIYRLRRSSPELGWKEITEQVNRKYKQCYSMNDLIFRYEAMTAKLSREQLSQVFAEFQRFQTNFHEIAARTNLALSQVKREVVSGLVNNIWKVCFIVRKRKISSLKSNFLDNEQMKRLAVMVLREGALKNVKQEYAELWRFISNHCPDDYYHTVSDHTYKLLYRELIILVEKFRIHPQNTTIAQNSQQGESSSSFEQHILQQNANQDHIQSILDIAKSRKKANKETINLVSDEEHSEHEESALSISEYDLVQSWRNNILRESVGLYHELQVLERALELEADNQQLRRQRAERAIGIVCLQIMSRRDCQ